MIEQTQNVRIRVWRERGWCWDIVIQARLLVGQGVRIDQAAAWADAWAALERYASEWAALERFASEEGARVPVTDRDPDHNPDPGCDTDRATAVGGQGTK